MGRFSLCIVFSVIIFFIQTSCKKNEVDSYNNQKFTDFFRFDLVINIQDTTDLILYYKDGSNEWFVDDKTIWQTISGSEENQLVIFLFQDETVPHDFRLDIGRNEYNNQKDFKIVNATFYYKKNKFEISGSDFEVFFRPNQYIRKNPLTQAYSLNPDENKNFDPFFETTPSLYPQIVKLVLN